MFVPVPVSPIQEPPPPPPAPMPSWDMDAMLFASSDVRPENKVDVVEVSTAAGPVVVTVPTSRPVGRRLSVVWVAGEIPPRICGEGMQVVGSDGGLHPFIELPILRSAATVYRGASWLQQV